MNNGNSELQNYVITTSCNSVRAQTVKCEPRNYGIAELLNIVPFGPEFCPQESYAAVQNCVLPGSVPPPRAALVRALP